MLNADNKRYIQNNNYILTLRDKDIFINALIDTNIVWKDRITGKAVIFDKDLHIALIGNKVNEFFLLPGGGIEEGEEIIDGIKRECKEETGCDVSILGLIGSAEDFRARDSKHCISYGYFAEVVSMGNRNLTESEKDIGAYVKWVPINDAIQIFIEQEKQVKIGNVKFYNTCFNILRDSLFIRLAKDLISNPILAK